MFLPTCLPLTCPQPELAFGAMACLWLVASIVYLAEIVGRNMDYQLRERGFPLKILTSVSWEEIHKLTQNCRELTSETGSKLAYKQVTTFII